MKLKFTRLLSIKLLLAILLTLFLSSSFAQTNNTWTGAASTVWTASGNWNLGHAPTSTEVAVFDGVTVSVTGIVRTQMAGLKLTNNANVTFSNVTAPTAITSTGVSRTNHTNTVTVSGGTNPISNNFIVGDLLTAGASGTTGGNISFVKSVAASSATTDETYFIAVTTANQLYRAQTLILSGTGTGEGLTIDAGSTLSINSAAHISLLTGVTGTISGRINFTPSSANAIRINVTDDRALKFKSGSVFVMGNFAGGWPFGFNSTSTAHQGKVVFESGSSYYHAAVAGAGIGANNQWASPFGGHAPATAVEFNEGSNYIFCNGTSISLSASNTFNAFFGVGLGTAARHLSNLQISANSTSFGGIGTANTTINLGQFPRVNNVTLDASQALTWNQGSSTGWPMMGNVAINGTIPNNSANANSLRLYFGGTSAQTVTGFAATSSTFSPLAVTVANGANVTFANNLVVYPGANGTVSTVYGRLNMGTNTFTNAHPSNTHSITIAAATANFTKTGGIVSAGCPIVTGLNNTTSVAIGMGVTGTGIPTGTSVLSTVSAVTIGSTNTVTAGSNVITANTISATTGAGAGISGTGIPSGTIISTTYGTAVLTGTSNTVTASTTVTLSAGFASTPTPGMIISGTGIPANTIITAAASATSVTVNQAVTISSGTALTCTPTIVLSQLATASGSNVSLTTAASVILSQVPTSSSTGVTLTFSNSIGTLATANTGGLDGSYTSTRTLVTQPTNTGNVEINGATTTPLPAAWTAAATLNNFTSSADVTLNKNLTVNGALTVSSGTLTVDAGGRLTTGGTISNSGSILVKSTSSASGTLINNSSNTISNVTLQQWVTGQRGYRILSNPFTTSLTPSTVGTANGITITGASDVKTYNTSTNVWTGSVSSIAANTPYSVFIRGLASEVTGLTYSAGPTAFAYNVTGTLNGNSVTLNQDKSSATAFTIAGNPFAAPVNSSALTGGVASTPYYIYSMAQNAGGGTRVKAGGWVAAASNSSTTTPIPMMGVVAYQAGTGASSTFSVASTSINTTDAAQTGLFGEGDATTQLELQVSKDGIYQDKLFVRFDANSTEKGTERMDLQKLNNDVTNIYTITSDKARLAVDARKGIDDIIPIGVTSTVGKYSFTVASNNFVNASNVYLLDKLTNTKTALVPGATYSFEITSDAATQGDNRFELGTVKTQVQDAVTNDNFSVKVLGNVVNNAVTVQVRGAKSSSVQITVVDMQGKLISNITSSREINNLALANGSGMYLIKVTDGENSIVSKVVKP